MSKMIQPNQLEQATKGLSNLNLGKFEIPNLINDGEKTDYVYICVKSKDNNTGTAKVHYAKVLYAPQGKHDEMIADQKRFGGIWNGMFQTVVILHNPTLPLVAEKKEATGKISNIDKNKIKIGHKDGLPAEEIANRLGLDLMQVSKYIQEKLK